VGYLLDQIRLHGESQELRQEVTDLARQYGIVTPYTAYLILEDETQRHVPLANQSFRRLSEDRLAQQAAEGLYWRMNRDRSGDTAVLSSRYGLALKQADNAQAVSQSALDANRTLSTAAAPALSASPALSVTKNSVATSGRANSDERLVEYTQQSRFVGGRNFFLNGRQWIDAQVQRQPQAPRVKLEFSSAEYFTFARTHPEAAPWLALGSEVQFVLDGKVFEVTSQP